jgi:citrate synthase
MSSDRAAPSDRAAATGVPTKLGSSTPTSITVAGQSLADDLMGQVSFGELAFWLVTMRRPAASELQLFEAVLVGLDEHGWTPIAIASRMTLLSAPESIQGAIASGLLGHIAEERRDPVARRIYQSVERGDDDR